MYNIIILFILLLIPTTVCNIIYPNPNPNFAKIIINNIIIFFFFYIFFFLSPRSGRTSNIFSLIKSTP